MKNSIKKIIVWNPYINTLNEVNYLQEHCDSENCNFFINFQIVKYQNVPKERLHLPLSRKRSAVWENIISHLHQNTQFTYRKTNLKNEMTSLGCGK